jgi:hypothetical protein
MALLPGTTTGEGVSEHNFKNEGRKNLTQAGCYILTKKGA